ncbi:MAG: phage tail tape measure protein [Candidatus Cloacimonadaceae bacterium]|jgi:TP901 family phage tail tape measure protein|nr:phage tail tape measure protein [Candidatus Cloacimonadaceae bacterium]
MADRTQELGTKFTGDIKDVSGKVSAFLQLLNKLEKANKSTANAAKNPWKGVAEAAQKHAATVTNATNKIVADAKKAQRAVGAIGDPSSGASGGIVKASQHATRGFSAILQSAVRVSSAYGLVGTAIFGVTKGMKEGVNAIIEYDQALKNLQAITGATNDQVAVMGEEIKRVANDTKFSTKEVADGMVLLGQAGLSAEEATNTIASASKLATGTLSTMEHTVDLLTSTLRSFNLDATESGRVADVFASAINKSKLTTDKLRTVFNYVGASAHQVGVSLEELAASTALLADRGFRASTIGTGLRQVIARLVSPGRALREEFKKHGIALESVNPMVVGYRQALQNLVPVMWDNEKKTVDMAKAYELFQLRGAQAAAVLVGSFAGSGFQKAIDNVSEFGAAERMASKQAEGLGVMSKNLWDKMGLLAIAIGDLGVTGALRIFINVMRDATVAATNLAKATKDFFGNLFETTSDAKAKFGEQAIENKRVSDSLRSYKKELGEARKELSAVGTVATRHITLLRRMISAHPELSKVIDLNKVSFDSFGSAISSVIRLMDEYDKKVASKRAKELSIIENQIAQQKKIDKLNEDSWNFRAPGTKGPINVGVKKPEDPMKATNALLEERREIAAEWAKDIAAGLDDSKNMEADAEKIVKSLESVGDVSSATASIMRNELAAAIADLKLEKGIGDDFVKNLKALPPAFQKVFDSLGGAKKIEFMQQFKQLENQIASVEDSFDANPGAISADDREKAIAEYQAEWLKMFQEKSSKAQAGITDNNYQEAQKRLQIEETYYAALARLTTDELQKLKSQRDKEHADIEKQRGEALRLTIKNRENIALVNKKYDDLQAQNDKKYEESVAKTRLEAARGLLDIENLKKKIANEEKKRGSVGSEETIDKMRAEEARITILYLEKIAEAERAHWQKVLAIRGAGSKEAIAAEQDFLTAVYALKSAETEEEQRQAEYRIKIRIKELEAKLKRTKKESEEYYAIMDQLRELGARTEYIDEEERLSRSNKFINGLELGLIRVQKAQKTLAQDVADTWEQTNNALADSFATLFDDVLAGKIKSAGDYIKSFLKSVASEINRTLAKSFASKATNWIGTLGTTALSAFSRVPGSSSIDPYIPMAKGGWITEAIVGRGVSSGKKYLLGEDGDELVVPKSKVASSPTSNNDYTINVPVSVSGSSKMEAISRTLRKEIESVVISVMKREMV